MIIIKILLFSLCIFSCWNYNLHFVTHSHIDEGWIYDMDFYFDNRG